jgi:hypothetical protein
MRVPAHVALLGLAVVGVLSDLACVLTGHAAPPLFESIALGGLTAAAGVSLPVRAADPQPAPVVYQQPVTTLVGQ